MILKEKRPKPKTYEISKRQTMTIDEVVAERAELLDVRGRGDWVGHIMEQFDARLRFLDSFIVDYFLKRYKVNK